MSSKLNIEELMQNAVSSANDFLKFNQEKVDKIVRAVYIAGFNNRIKLAKMARDETYLGVWEDKVIKNIIATHFVYNDIKDLQTVGVRSHNEEKGITEILNPLGPIFAVTPVTNPTSTALFKILISLKTRNPLIISPHGAAKKSTIEAAKICYEAALEAGAPKHCIQWISRASKDQVLDLMAHKKTALVLATGSTSLVKAANQSGTPTIGVGPGNVPVFFGKTADIEFSVDQIIRSKIFDNGTVCASEQALVLQKFNADKVIEEFKKRKAYFLNEEEISRLEPIAFNKAHKVMNVSVIGQSAYDIAKMAKIEVPEDTSVLIAKLNKVGIDSPLSLEILAPTLAMYIVEDIEEAISMCKNINRHGGLGHTVSIFSNNTDRIKYFASVMNAGRVIVNTPSSQGALGGKFNSLDPSLTLACGSGGKNITTDNITARHLLNIQRIAWRRDSDCLPHFENGLHYDETVDAKTFEEGCLK